MGIQKSCTVNIIPSNDFVCAESNHMCINVIQGGNGEPHHINLSLSHSLAQAQETIVMLSKKLQALQAHSKANKPTTEKPLLKKKTRDNKSKSYLWTHGSTRILDHNIPTCQYPKTVHQLVTTLENKMGGIDKWCK